MRGLSLVACSAVSALLGWAPLARAADSCATASDGRCDELSSCALGTDAADCLAACTLPWPAELVGPCAHQEALARQARPRDAAPGSNGNGGPRGVWSGTLPARSNSGAGILIRHYKVYVPPTYDPRVPTPLLYMLGAFTVDMYGLSAYTELLRTADLNGFLVVFPQQHYYQFSFGWVFAWNVYGSDWAGGDWSENPDVDFIRRLTLELKGLYNIDRSRVFASGHSRGAGMSIILAFELPDTIAGFVSQSGFSKANAYYLRMNVRPGARKVPGVLVHGVDDPDVPVAESDWTVQTLELNGWRSGTDFRFYRLPNVAHEWQPQLNQEIWDFLSARPLPVEELGQ